MREEFLRERLAAFLERLSPPQAIKGRPEAMRDEMQALFSALSHSAPSTGYEDWWRQFEGKLLDRMQTRAWPIVSEIRKAAADLRSERPPGGGPDAEGDELAIISAMARWLEKFGDEMPSTGRPDRTQKLIDGGFLRDEREARWRGFQLTSAQREKAMSQPCGDDEWRHHVKVMARLRGQDYATTDAQERAAMRASENSAPPDRRVVMPDKREVPKMAMGDW